MKIYWKNIALFLIMALALSLPVQRGYIDDTFKSFTTNSFLSESSYLLAGLSTLIAAFIALIFHKSISRRITVLGDDRIKNILISLLPVLAFSIVGLKNNFEINESVYGFAFALTNTVYAFTEEFGWRRYLQNALEGVNKNLKYILIGVVWWVWHFRFDSSFDLFIFPLICIGGGFLLGKLTDDSKSILPAVSMHTLIILTTNSGNFGKNEAIGIGGVIVGWIVIETIWKRKQTHANR